MSKIIFLDFDGTLTDGRFHIWKFLWKSSGYSISNNSYYAKLKKAFLKGEFSYSEWCNKSLIFFKNANLTKQKILKPIRKIKLLKNVKRFLKELYNKGYKIYILSGNFSEIIKKTLGKNITKKLTHIQANSFVFDNNLLTDFKVVDCDYNGKPQFIKQVLLTDNISPAEAIFIGNGKNDEGVKSTGVKTICINAEETDYKNKQYWDEYLFTNNIMHVLKLQKNKK